MSQLMILVIFEKCSSLVTNKLLFINYKVTFYAVSIFVRVFISCHFITLYTCQYKELHVSRVWSGRGHIEDYEDICCCVVYE